MNDRKILLIDYDSTSISRTATPLTKAGYEVEVATDGVSGLEAFERWHPALVLVEAMLPRKHGVEVCREIKSKPNGKSVPVLITSSVCRGRKYRVDAMEAYGCDDYVEKPIASADLVSMIARLLEAANEAREEIRQDLSEAIDAVSATETPPAIESMSDDEIDAKIDAMMLGDDSPVETRESPTPPPPRAETAATEPTADAPDPVFDVETEMERRLQAMVQADPVVADPSKPLAYTAQIERPAHSAVEAPVEPRIDQVVDAPPPSTAPAKTEKKAGSKALLFFALATFVAVVALAFSAFQLGWIGADGKSEPVSPEGGGFVQRPVETPPVVETPAPENPPAQEIAGPTPVEPEAAGEPVEVPVPKPVVRPRPTFKRRSAAEVEAARERQARADQALQAAAGSLQSQLLSEQTGELSVVEDDYVAEVDIAAADLIGTPVRPMARRGELFDISDVDRAPVPVKFEQPVYDELARRLRQQGVVLVEVLIDETGQVAEARLTQEIPRSRLNDSALRAARRWVYQPAVKDGVPVRVWKTERIAFVLE